MIIVLIVQKIRLKRDIFLNFNEYLLQVVQKYDKIIVLSDENPYK